MATALTTRDARHRRHLRIRKKVEGTIARPRLSVFRSLNHIYAQVIDDERGETVAAASTLDAGLEAGKSKTQQAAQVGTLLAERAKAKGISSVVFDRGGYKFHGRVKALADAARAAGLTF